MPAPETTAETFRQLDFHDDTFVGMQIVPAQRRGEGIGSVIEIELPRCSENTVRVLRFFGCANLRVAMDFDVLAWNLPPNTSDVDAFTNVNRIRDFMQSQKKDWGVEYNGTEISPLAQKLTALGDVVLFRVQFFGGVVDVIARDYRAESANDKMQ
jgi:hypothetical protein